MKRVSLSFILIICIFLSSVQKSISQSNATLEKIEMIIQLTRFIDWSEKNESLNSKQLLYVLTDNNLSVNYEIRSKQNDIYKNWQIKCTETISNFEEGAAVFVTKDKNAYSKKVIELSKDRNILTIAEENNSFCSKGGMINISDRNNSPKFEINYKIIQQKSLNISSKVLALAKIYDE